MKRPHSERTLTVRAGRGKHRLFHADSRQCNYVTGFSLVLTSPPYYHPTRTSSRHGIGFTGDIEKYVSSVADILARCSYSADKRRVCFIKTDVWYKGALIPLGYELMRACVKNGLCLRAHWIWERLRAFSPYAPAFSNIFVFGEEFVRPHFSGVIGQSSAMRKRRLLPRSYSPEIFRFLMEHLTERGDVVLDPFAGTGGVIEAADGCSRWGVGIEVSKEQIRAALSHLRPIATLSA